MLSVTLLLLVSKGITYVVYDKHLGINQTLPPRAIMVRPRS